MISEVCLRSLRRLGVLLAIGLIAMPSARADFTIRSGATQLDNGTLTTRADIELDLSQQAQDALVRGIPLTIVLEMTLSRRRSIIWDERIAQWRFTRELSYHSLSGRYIVKGLNGAGQHSYRTLNEALDAIGSFTSTWHSGDAVPAPPAGYWVALRVRLDPDSLPAPLRLVAMLWPGWRLSSGWEEWQVQ